MRVPLSIMRRQPMLVPLVWEISHEIDTGGMPRRPIPAVLQRHRQRTEVGRLPREHDLYAGAWSDDTSTGAMAPWERSRSTRSKSGLPMPKAMAMRRRGSHHIAHDLGTLEALQI